MAATAIIKRGKTVVLFYDGAHDMTGAVVSDDIPPTGKEMAMSFKAYRTVGITQTTATLYFKADFGEGAVARWSNMYCVPTGGGAAATNQAALLGNTVVQFAVVLNSTSAFKTRGGHNRLVRIDYSPGDASAGVWIEFSIQFDYENEEDAMEALLKFQVDPGVV